MADTNRLARLTRLTARGESKLLLVGDQRATIRDRRRRHVHRAPGAQVPTAEVSEVHRAQHEWERDAWAQVRDGQSQHALAGYQAHHRLHIADTRAEAAERMVSDWDRTRREHPGERTVMLTDASNVELDRINALAQERRGRGRGARRRAAYRSPIGPMGSQQVTRSSSRRRSRPRTSSASRTARSARSPRTRARTV